MIDYKMIPVDVIEHPQREGQYAVLLDRWWAFIPYQGVIFAIVGEDRFVSPQCNSDLMVVKGMIKNVGYPDGTEPLLVPRAFVPMVYTSQDNEWIMTVPWDEGVRV